MAPLTDIERAYNALKAKHDAHTLYFDYYDGNQKLRYVSDRLHEVFGRSEAQFTQNWSAVVADSELERIHLKEFQVTPPAPSDTTTVNAAATSLQARLNDLFVRTELNLDAMDVHTAGLVCGEAFVFVWKDDADEIEAYYNDPRLCHIFYDSEKPRVKTFATKWWVNDEDEKCYLNLYYEDRIEYYVSTRKAASITSGKFFRPTEEESAPNPFGVIPIFHFRRERRVIKSILKNVIEPQDAINKLTADLLVAAEFGAFKQRWILTNAPTSALKNAPNEIWNIPKGDTEEESTQVGEFDATDLTNYLNAIDKFATNIAIITRTPKHYFFNQGGDPSGEALIAMEAPLNKKAQTDIDHFAPTWAQVGAFMLVLDGKGPVTPDMVTPVFERPETVQPRTRAEIRETNTRAGIPIETTLRDEGWSDEKLKQLAADKDKTEQRKSNAGFTPEDNSAVENDLNGLGIADLMRATNGAAVPVG